MTERSAAGDSRTSQPSQSRRPSSSSIAVIRAARSGCAPVSWRSDDGWRSPTAKFLSPGELRALNERLAAREGDLLLLVADRPATANAVLAQLRLELAERFELIAAGERFVWIVDWPMFEWNDEDSRWDPLHHPFTAPQGEFDADHPGQALAAAYDIVWNGQELGGGSIRIHSAEVQEQVFAALGIDRETAEARFGFLLEALHRPAPGRRGVDPRRDRVPEDRLGGRSAHRRAGAGRRCAASRARDPGSTALLTSWPFSKRSTRNDGPRAAMLRPRSLACLRARHAPCVLA